MRKKDFEVQVLVNGNPVKEYWHEGQAFIEAKEGSSYSIKVKNNSSRRISAVITVDGLSVIDGREGSYRSTGYIVNGRSAITIDGWRKDENEVAVFEFTSPDRAYSKLIGKGENLGVIGVAIFYEKEVDFWPESNWTYIDSNWPYFDPFKLYSTSKSGFYFQANDTNSSTCNSSCGLQAEGSWKQSVGTGWGERKKSEVSEVCFVREEDSRTEFVFFYNTKEELKKKGIDTDKETLTLEPARAFPGEERKKTSKYCVEPPSQK